MKKVKNIVKNKTTRSQSKKENVTFIQNEVKTSFNLGKNLIFLLKLITFPFYYIYILLFKIPTDGPAQFLGFLRFVFFVSIGMFLEQHHRFEFFIKDCSKANNWIGGLSEVVIATHKCESK